MVREDLVNSAISFLQDPTVASAPLEKRISFLQSKNLTQEEIDVALARAGDGVVGSPNAVTPQQQSGYGYRQAPPPPGYGGYPPAYWQAPPPEVPRRDWRDWFIMATVMGGVGFGVYVTAKRYILPLISPPTPPQLTQDKTAIDTSFDRAFTMLDQLGNDTQALKTAEEGRTERLDTALTELETVLGTLKAADRRREDDARRNTDELRVLRDLIPKALEAEKTATEGRLQDLSNELRSLKTLVGNRMGASAGSTPAAAAASTVTSSSVGVGTAHRSSGSFGASGIVGGLNGTAHGGAVSPAQPSPGIGAAPEQSGVDTAASLSAATAVPAATQGSRFSSRKAAIPDWQMAAAKKSQQANGDQDTSTSGTVEDAESRTV